MSTDQGSNWWGLRVQPPLQPSNPMATILVWMWILTDTITWLPPHLIFDNSSPGIDTEYDIIRLCEQIMTSSDYVNRSWHHQIMWTDHDIIKLCEQKTCRCSVNTIDTYQSRFDLVDFGRAVLEADLSTLDSFRREFYENMDCSKKLGEISTRIF